MKTIKTIVKILVAIAAVMTVIGVAKKPGSVYRDKPDEKNPMEGKRVKFVTNSSEPANADGVRGHLEAIEELSMRGGVYDRVIKRFIDIVLSFFGLIILSPVFLLLCIAIKIDDPGPIFFAQKRIGKNKQYFRLHNIFEKAA